MSSEGRDSKFIIISRSTRDDYRWPSSQHLSLVDFSVASVTHRTNKNLCCSRWWLSVRRQIIVQRCIPRRVETSNSADSIVASLLVRRFLLVFLPRPREQRHTSHYVGRVAYTRTTRCLGRHRRPLRKIEFVCELREPNCADGISSSPSTLFLSVDKVDTARQKKMREREREGEREYIVFPRQRQLFMTINI